MKRVVITYLVSVLLAPSLVFSLSLCNTTWNYLEVKEGRSNNFTCTGLTRHETVYWLFYNGGISKTIFECSPPPSRCFSVSRLIQFTASRTSGTASVFTIDASEISDTNYLGTSTLVCEASTSAFCQLDSVYPAENSSCQVQFKGSTVTTWCSVSKVRSARNNYRCFLYQAQEASQATSVGSYTMNVLQAPSGYFSGTCNMTFYLPPEGRYSYYVIIMPGEVNVSATFIGNNTISRPRVKPTHDCPLYLNEGENLNCSCFVSDLGNPAGVLRWNNTDSKKLEFKNLQKSQNGIQSVCILTWNNTVHQSVSYTLIVVCPPRVKPTHDCPLYLNEGDSLNCSCFASDLGNPPGILRWSNTDSIKLEFNNLKNLHNGIESVCSLTWNNTVHQSVSYTLIVAYQPTWVSFTMNTEKSEDVFVDEKSSVTMKCQADGNPAPRMTITEVRDNSVLKTVPEGRIILKDQRGEITHTVTAAQCSDTDKYRCTAANSLGMKVQSVSLFVNCKPRRVGPISTTPIILEGKTTFELIAYPNSVNVTTYFIRSKKSGNETLASDDIVRVDCTSNCQLLYKVTCTVTVIRMTPNTTGLYKVVVSNDLGSVALIFEALPPNTTESEKSEFSQDHKAGVGTGLGVGLGLAAAEAVVFTVVLVLWWRRNHHTSKAKGGRENARYSSRQDVSFDKSVELSEPPGFEHESTYENVGNSETGQTAIYTNVEISNLTSKKTSKNTGNLYDDLHLQDVGVSFPYASLTVKNISKSKP